MSHQKQVLREIARVISDNEPFRIDEWFTEDFKLVEPTKPSWPRGHEGARKLLGLLRTLTPPLNYVALDMVEEADRVAVRWQLSATYQGEPLRLASIAIYRFMPSAADPNSSRLWRNSSNPSGCFPQRNGGSREARFKRLRRRSSNSAALHLRRRKPLATFAMVGRAGRNAEFCPALRRSRCAGRHMAPLGGLRSSADRYGACGRCRAEQEYQAGGQRFPENRLRRPMSAPWPWASPLPLPAARPLDRPSLGTGQCVLL
jgi:hypothetical protein